ncbi:MAG: NAD(P)-dependent oxidoreductase [Gammaproteobacteria bacterium]|nr:NAD(P)-dependent oxidoreductase [Gammaproteobacteria bacterium]
MNILITGGTGFIGSRMALKALEAGHLVRILGAENTPAEKCNRGLIESKGVEVCLGSVTQSATVESVTKGIDVVFHLAAAQHEANVPDTVFNDVNVGGTETILEASLRAGVSRVIYGSTIGVYGALEGTIDEESPLNPDNIYGRTKLEAERMVVSYANRLSVSAIRISETYGPGDRRLLKLFKAIDKEVFFIIGTGKNLHHLIYVDDLIRGFFLAAEAERACGEVFVLAGPRPVSTREMADIIADDLGKKVRRVRFPLFPFDWAASVMEATLKPFGIQPPLHRRRMDFFKKSFELSADKARRLLGFSAETEFPQGVGHTSQWYRQEGLL